ncbi:MAG TPA: hypothetical protein VFR58_13035 [Flavisolibacter sp.]|nr:hypothetical protein [Flavisolibacter sp.]
MNRVSARIYLTANLTAAILFAFVMVNLPAGIIIWILGILFSAVLSFPCFLGLRSALWLIGQWRLSSPAAWGFLLVATMLLSCLPAALFCIAEGMKEFALLSLLLGLPSATLSILVNIPSIHSFIQSSSYGNK